MLELKVNFIHGLPVFYSFVVSGSNDAEIQIISRFSDNMPWSDVRIS